MIGRSLGLTVAVMMVVFGVIFTFQGLGYIEGSVMTDSRTWATIGPILAGFGVALGIVVARPRR